MQPRIAAGAKVLIGMPAKPNQQLAQSLAELIASFGEVQAAHLPMVSEPNSLGKPALVLFLIFDPSCSYTEVVEQITQRLSPHIGPGAFLDIWPMKSDDPFLYWVEKARSRIFNRSPSGEPIIEHPWSRWRLLLWRLTRNFK
jgi:SseB protein C-terminal domain